MGLQHSATCYIPLHPPAAPHIPLHPIQVSLLHSYDVVRDGDGTAALAAAIEHMGEMLALPAATVKPPTPPWVAAVLVRRAKLLVEHANGVLSRQAGLGTAVAEADRLYKTAVEDLTRATKLRPPPPRLLLGEALLCRGQLEGRVARKRALADLATASALLPTDARPCMARGMLLEGQVSPATRRVMRSMHRVAPCIIASRTASCVPPSCVTLPCVAPPCVAPRIIAPYAHS